MQVVWTIQRPIRDILFHIESQFLLSILICLLGTAASLTLLLVCGDVAVAIGYGDLLGVDHFVFIVVFDDLLAAVIITKIGLLVYITCVVFTTTTTLTPCITLSLLFVCLLINLSMRIIVITIVLTASIIHVNIRHIIKI